MMLSTKGMHPIKFKAKSKLGKQVCSFIFLCLAEQCGWNLWSNYGPQQWTDNSLTWLLWSGLRHVQNNSPCKGRSIIEEEYKLSNWENVEGKVSGFSSTVGQSFSRTLVARSWDFCACSLNLSSNFLRVWYTEGDESFSCSLLIFAE